MAVGGPAAAVHPEANPVVGDDRFDTAARIADAFVHDARSVVLARGEDPADALAGGAHAVRSAGVLLTTPRLQLGAAPSAWLCTHRDGLSDVVAAGGPVALHDSVLGAAAAITRDRIGCPG